MGLLSRASALRDDKTELPDDQELIDSARKILSEQEILSASQSLLSLISTHFPVEKSALLFKDDTYFTIWACEGLDKTTSFRFRIPVSILSEEHLMLSGRTMRWNRQKLEILEQYLSVRLFDSLTAVYLVPLINDFSINGLLVCFQEETKLFPDENEQLAMLEMLVRKAENVLLKRVPLIRKHKNLDRSGKFEEFTSLLSNVMSLYDKKKLNLMIYKLNTRCFDFNIRISDFIISIFISFMNDRGKFHLISPDTLCLVFHRETVDSEILEIQINKNLKQVYPGNTSEKIFTILTMEYPDEAKILKKFFPEESD